jgi:hypothetical protein
MKGRNAPVCDILYADASVGMERPTVGRDLGKTQAPASASPRLVPKVRGCATRAGAENAISALPLAAFCRIMGPMVVTGHIPSERER